jgi:RHS repeat-associated protein
LYPFGLKHKEYYNVISSNGNSVAQKFKYNGKELTEDLGLNWYDYGARHYDAALGRFHNVDRYSEDFSFQSHYVYAANNPVIFIDKNGDGPILGILGAFAGAIVEAGSQVVGAMATGSSFSEAISDIDYADVGIAAAEYGLAGLTNGASLVVTSKIADAAQAAIDITGDGQVTTVFGSNNGKDAKSLDVAATEFVVGKVVGNVSNKAGKAIKDKVNTVMDKTIKNQTSNLVGKSKNLTSANNSVANGNTNSKQKLPRQAFNEFSVAKDKVLTTKQVKGAVNSKGAKNVATVATKATATAANKKAQEFKGPFLNLEDAVKN